MAAAPIRPGQHGCDICDRVQDQCVGQAAEFGNGQRDQLGVEVGGRRLLAVQAGEGDGEDRQGDHREEGVSVPGGPGAALVVVEADEALTELE